MSSTYDIPRHCLSIGDDILVHFLGDRNWSDAKITEARGDHDCEVVLNSGERKWIQLDKVEFMPRTECCFSARKKTKLDGMERDCSICKGNCSNDESGECATKTDHKENTAVNMTCGQLNVKIQRPSVRVTSVGSDASRHTGGILHEQPSGNFTLLSTCGATADAICSVCQSGVAGKFIVQCKDSRCSLSFHTFCLHPPVETIEKDWSCPNCSGCCSQLAKDKKQIAKRIHKIFGYKKVNLEDKENGDDELLLIKWASLSHHHDTWVPRTWLYIFDRLRLHSYVKKIYNMGGSEIDERKPEWYNIDRVIACRKKCVPDKPVNVWEIFDTDYGNGEFEYLVKWRGLDYSESTWESNCTTELLDEVNKLSQRHKWAAERVQHFSLDVDVKPQLKISNELYGDTLYDYQLQGLNWLLGNFKARKNVILADEMGLGKTVQAVTFINCMKQERLNIHPALVLAPKSILFQWEKEFRCWAKDLNVIIYQGEKTSLKCIHTHEMYSSGKTILFDALITNYERLLLDKNVLRKFKWSAIIIDEAHKIKRLDCKLLSLLKRYSTDFRLLLTGTPLQNTLLELFALLHFIDPERFSDPEEEAKSYASIKNHSHGVIESKLAEIQELLKPRMLRRMKSSVLRKSIPVKKWVEVPCALTDKQRDLYINILEKNYKKLNEKIICGRKITLNFILMELKKCCNHPYLFPGQESNLSSKDAVFSSLISASGKLQFLEKMLPRLIERGNRVLLFCQMTKMLYILEDFLAFLNITYFRIDGGTSIALRQQQMKDFNNPECPVSVFLMSTRAGGLGIDLPTADRVIIYDPDFNPFMDLQAQSRAHRIGQTRSVVVYQLITKCSVEVKILRRSKEKLAMENLIMNQSKKANVDELHSILLHGAKTILNRKNVKATSIQYDDTAIDALLKLDPAPDEICPADDDNGYLGTIQSFAYGNDADEGESNAKPNSKEWENILGPVRTNEEMEDFGKGKRRRKLVAYNECESSSGSEDVYAPESSSSSDSSDDSSYDGM